MKHLPMLLLATTLAATSASAEIIVKVYADDAYPPYSYREAGKMKGVYHDILQKLFSRMPGYAIQIKGIKWKQGLRRAEEGTLFALYPPYARPDSRPYMDYDAPILDETVVVVCRDEILKKPRSRWPQDYYGLAIGNNTGFSAGGDEFRQAVAAGKITLKETSGTAKNLRLLLAGRADCYMNDELSIQWELKKLQQQGEYSGTGLKKGAVLSREQGYLGFSNSSQLYPYKEEFKSEYLRLLQQMKDNGEIEQIVKRYAGS